MASAKLSYWIDPAGSRRNLRLLRAVVWLIAIGAGLLQAAASRFFLSPDALAYLDIASAYLRGDWKNAVNAYWSPLFSWLIALCLGTFRPAPYWESTVLHLLNFVGLLVTLRCFEFFFRSFLRMRGQSRWGAEQVESLPEVAWWALGYGLFLSTSLFIQTVIPTTPDMWVAVFTYIIAGLVLRIWAEGGGGSLFAALGFTLGCAYLTKAFYFPLSFVLLPTAWVATGNPRKTAKQFVLGLAAFVLVAGPWVAALSRAKGRITFGEVGKLSFAMIIDQIPQPHLWQGGDGAGTPKHPVRQLLRRPQLYEYAEPVSGTYPPGFDWSYWMEGMRPYFSLPGVLKVLRQSAGTFFQIWMLQLEYSVGLLTLLFLSYRKAGWIFPLRQHVYLWLPPLVACSAYAIVLVEPRYVAPFVLLLWVAAFSSFLPPAPEIPVRAVLALILAVVSVTGLRVAKAAVSDLAATLTKQENVDWQVAKGLRAIGLQPGDHVSCLSLGVQLHWARLAGIKIVSEIPLGDGNIFWTEDPEARRRVLEVFASTGAKVVVTTNPPLSALDEGWIPLGNTAFYAHRLPPKPD
jgi:hypothetical protein